MLDNIRIVLIETTHPGNIGAVARAMLTMGLQRLVLVQPQTEPCAPVALARASGAQTVLEQAQVVADLPSAVADCRCVIGSSARPRDTLWQPLDPRACASLVRAQVLEGPVALVFGRESSGLTRAELDQCQHLVHIPANPAYTSLNIAMAVQVLAYEMRMAAGQEHAAPTQSAVIDPRDQAATHVQMQGLFTHLQATLHKIGFLQTGQASSTLRRLQRLLYRADPVQRDVQMLRGILSAVQQRSRDA